MAPDFIAQRGVTFVSYSFTTNTVTVTPPALSSVHRQTGGSYPARLRYRRRFPKSNPYCLPAPSSLALQQPFVVSLADQTTRDAYRTERRARGFVPLRSRPGSRP